MSEKYRLCVQDADTDEVIKGEPMDKVTATTRMISEAGFMAKWDFLVTELTPEAVTMTGKEDDKLATRFWIEEA